MFTKTNWTGERYAGFYIEDGHPCFYPVQGNNKKEIEQTIKSLADPCTAWEIARVMPGLGQAGLSLFAVKSGEITRRGR